MSARIFEQVNNALLLPLGTLMKQPAPMVYKAAVLAAIAFFIPQLTLFKSSTVVRAHSQDLANAAFGDTRWLLPHPEQGFDRQIVVLLADEASLELTGSQWPPGETYHASVMRELAAYGPTAVFLDFLFMDRRDEQGAQELKNALAFLETSKARVYLPAHDERTLKGLQYASNELAMLRRVGVGHLTDAGDSLTRQYPWFGGDASEPVPSAAMQIYCDEFPGQGVCAQLSRHRYAAKQRTFDLIWNTRPHGFNVRWHPRDCQPEFKPGWRDMALGKWQSLDACPAYPTVFVSELFAGAAPGQTAPTTQELIELLQGSIVMYGSAFEEAGDTITSGVLGELPGTYYHATALDNLLAFNGRPKMRRELHDGVIWHKLLHFLFLAGLAGLFLHRQRLLAQQSVPRRRGGTTLRKTLVRELAKLPFALIVIPVIIFLLVAATQPALRLSILMILAILAIVTEILRGADGQPRRIALRFAIYAGSVALSLLAMLFYGWLAFHVLDEPPLDWFGITAFITFGWFLAYAAVGDLLDELWASRMSRTRKQAGASS